MLETSERILRTVCVFCGSSSGARPDYEIAAAKLGRALTRRNIALVYGGARVGLMRAVADAVLETGGKVVGVIPELLVSREIAHDGLTELRVVGSMHERKATMAELADAFLLLPGGFGSWEEFCEVVTWAHLGLHAKPCGLLNVSGYYSPFLALAERAVAEGFVRASHQQAIVVDEDPDRLLDQLGSVAAISESKWTAKSVRSG
jgi:uncharacterized protein (TIGR00730 family)